MLKAFAVFDMKAESYGNPMFVSNEGLALRGFSDACADPKSPAAQHPEDYILYMIGSYEPNTGILDSLVPPKQIASATAVVALLQPAAVVPQSEDMIKRLKDGALR